MVGVGEKIESTGVSAPKDVVGRGNGLVGGCARLEGA